MTQSTLEFHPAKADFAREHGMTLATSNRAELLAKAREVALWLGRNSTPVTVDDVFKGLAVYGHKPEELGNASGSIFLGREWRCVGFTRSIRVSNHSRTVRMWVKK